MARYPQELEQPLQVAGLGPAVLRPIRPADAEHYRRHFHVVPPDDIRRRFHMPLGRLSEAMIERLTCIDYEREMAFVVEAHDAIVGVGRLADDDVALLVCPSRRRLGIGSLLVRRLVTYARDRGYRALHGDIQADNLPMLALARRLGCALSPSPEGAALVRATLPLR